MRNAPELLGPKRVRVGYPLYSVCRLSAGRHRLRTISAEVTSDRPRRLVAVAALASSGALLQLPFFEVNQQQRYGGRRHALEARCLAERRRA